MSDERLAQLETIADDSIISTCAKIMQEFKDGKSGEWNLDYWIRLAQGKDVEAVEPAVLVDMDPVVQSQDGVLLLLLS